MLRFFCDSYVTFGWYAHLLIGFVGSYTTAFVPARLLGCIIRQDDEGEKL